jgi:hypothetical protein
MIRVHMPEVFLVLFMSISLTCSLLVHRPTSSCQFPTWPDRLPTHEPLKRFGEQMSFNWRINCHFYETQRNFSWSCIVIDAYRESDQFLLVVARNPAHVLSILRCQRTETSITPSIKTYGKEYYLLRSVGFRRIDCNACRACCCNLCGTSGWADDMAFVLLMLGQGEYKDKKVNSGRSWRLDYS